MATEELALAKGYYRLAHTQRISPEAGYFSAYINFAQFPTYQDALQSILTTEATSTEAADCTQEYGQFLRRYGYGDATRVFHQGDVLVVRTQLPDTSEIVEVLPEISSEKLNIAWHVKVKGVVVNLAAESHVIFNENNPLKKQLIYAPDLEDWGSSSDIHGISRGFVSPPLGSAGGKRLPSAALTYFHELGHQLLGHVNLSEYARETISNEIEATQFAFAVIIYYRKRGVNLIPNISDSDASKKMNEYLFNYAMNRFPRRTRLLQKLGML